MSPNFNFLQIEANKPTSQWVIGRIKWVNTNKALCTNRHPEMAPAVDFASWSSLVLQSLKFKENLTCALCKHQQAAVCLWSECQVILWHKKFQGTEHSGQHFCPCVENNSGREHFCFLPSLDYKIFSLPTCSKFPSDFWYKNKIATLTLLASMLLSD